MFERFTDRARRVVVLAQEEARLLNHSHIGTEHLLLGMIHEGEGVAALALAGVQIDLDGMRSDVKEIIGVGDRAPEPGHVPFTPRAKKVLELSLREALELGHNYIGTEHILLGLLREHEGVAAQVLAKRGVALPDLRRQVIDLMTGARAAMAAPAEGAGPAAAPTCPGCGTSLDGQLGMKVLGTTGDATGESIPVPVVYCRRCGRALGVVGTGG